MGVRISSRTNRIYRIERAGRRTFGAWFSKGTCFELLSAAWQGGRLNFVYPLAYIQNMR